MVVVEVRKRGERTRGESLQARQARLCQQSQRGKDHDELIARTFSIPRVAEQPKKRSFHDTRIPHHTI